MVILNPAARSAKAAGVSREIEALCGEQIVFRRTSGSGDALRLARQAVRENFDRVIAAGGDGTVNGAVNGIAGSSAALGILPMGTMNVFASELGIPRHLKEAWDIIETGNVREIDLSRASGHAFVQMAGVGFDAQALLATSWDAKRNLGPLSYVISAAQVAARKPPRLQVEAEGTHREGSFVLIGNGRYYGGPLPMFPQARIDDGRLDVIVFKHLSHLDLIRYLQGAIFGTHLGMPDVEYFQTGRLTVSSDSVVPVEVDGEVIGNAPVIFECKPRDLRVLAP